MRRVLLGCFLSTIILQPLQAQNSPTKPVTALSDTLINPATTPVLDPVTVTAGMKPSRVSTTGRNMIVISGADFDKLPVRSLDDLLRYVPGIEVQQRGPMGAQADITLRGGTFQQVLVLIDGMRVNDANTGHFSGYIPIAPGEIDRIELLKGASSAIYGSDAVGGVVHIITKAFANTTQPSGFQLNGQWGLGEYGYFGGNAGVQVRTGRTTVTAGILSNETSGQLQRGARGFVNSNTVSASIGRQFTNGWRLSLRGAFDRRRFGAQNFYTTSLADTAQETVSGWWTQAQAVKENLNSTWRIAAGYKWLQDSFSFNRVSVSNQNKSRLAQLLATNEHRLTYSSSLVTGVQAVQKIIRSNDRGNHSVGQAAVFAVLNIEPIRHLALSPAARAEWNERSGLELVPQLNISYRTNAWQLRASGGKTIRDADFTERFNNYGKAIVTSGQRLGNPALTAERSWSYEAGADWLGLREVKISGSFFQRFHRELIDYVLTPYTDINRKENLLPAGVYAYAKNIAEVTTTGAELDIQWNKTFTGQQRLMLLLGNTRLRSRSNNTLPSFYLASHARFLSNFSIQYSGKGGAVALTGLYKARQATSPISLQLANASADYFVMNLKAEAALRQQSLWGFVQLDNLFDRQYADLLGAVMPGRWFTAGVRFAIKEAR